MSDFYITMGQNHIHKIGNNVVDKDSIAVINARDYEYASHSAFELFGDKFAFIYSEDSFDRAMMKYFPRGFIRAN